MANKEKQISCGIYFIDSRGKVLIVHSTGSPIGEGWGIPKGLCDAGETFFETAIREMNEETGIDIREYKGKIYSIGSTKYKSKNKIVIGFIFDSSDTVYHELHCDSFIKRSGLPEIDMFEWVSPTQAIKRLHETQSQLLSNFIYNQDWFNGFDIDTYEHGIVEINEIMKNRWDYSEDTYGSAS